MTNSMYDIRTIQLLKICIRARTTKDFVIIELLIYHGVKINARNKDGETPLMLLSRGRNTRYFTDRYYGNYVNIIKCLIQHGADVNACDEYGQTPLIIASGSPYNYDIMELLINNNADVNAVTNNGYSPLHGACLFKTNINIITLLVKHNAIINSFNINDETPLTFARDCNLEQPILDLLYNTLLIQLGLIVNISNVSC